jgi:flagellar basal-body rod protein FlgF
MDISSYVLLSHEQALRRKLDVAANNMANMSTAGFKREQPIFREFVEKADQAMVPDAKQTSFVLDFGQVHDTAIGSFQATSNPLDVMIDGPGYLAVEAPNGGTAYTRAGYVKLLEGGDLATAGGQRILGEGGKPINIPTEEQASLNVAVDGTVMGRNGPLGRLAVTVFDDERGVDARGDGLFDAQNGRELGAAETRLRAGGIESSNVQPIVETTSMVEILRAYQTSVQMNQNLADMRKNAIDRLGRFT